MSDPPNPPPAEKERPDHASAVESLKISSSVSKKENIRTIRAILDELLRVQKDNQFKLSDWISVALGLSFQKKAAIPSEADSNIPKYVKPLRDMTDLAYNNFFFGNSDNNRSNDIR